ncbi:MAG: NYN domain-containing protein [Deltaproteobacteria bacterium]|jgi:hypothetical protein|nr:NYN domain-containing protein [Deltaproteobacteria bacterium]
MDAIYQPASSDLKTAVLIDATSFPPEMAAPVFAILAQRGLTLTVKRAYADWTNHETRPWVDLLAQWALIPEQWFEDSPDVSLTIEALDLLNKEKVSAFALLTGNGALRRLAMRLRESGATVLGFLSPPASPDLFRATCSEFWSTDDLINLMDNGLAVKEPEPPLARWEPAIQKAEIISYPAPEPSPLRWAPSVSPPSGGPPDLEDEEDDLSHFREVLKKAIAENEDDDGWAKLSTVGSSIKSLWPAFDVNNFGYKNLKSLLESSSDLVRINTGTPLMVRLLDDFI